MRPLRDFEARNGSRNLATVAPCAKLIVVDVRSLSLAATSMSPILCVSFRHDVVWLTSGFEMQSWRTDLERHAIGTGSLPSMRSIKPKQEN